MTTLQEFEAVARALELPHFASISDYSLHVPLKYADRKPETTALP